MHVGIVTRCEVPYALDLANQLYETGVSITLYMCREHVIDEVGTSDHPEEKLYEMGLLPRECKIRLVQLPRFRDPRSFAVFRQLSQIIREDGVDVANLLVASSEIWFAVLAHLLRGVPVTCTMTQPTRDIGERFPFWVIWAIQKLLAMGSTNIIVNGVDQPELIHRHYQVPLERVSFIPLSARTTAVKQAKRLVNEEPGTVLFFGRAVPHKGLEYLVRAQPLVTRQIPNARFLIVAHGEDLERCLQLIEDPDRFEIHPDFVSGDEMAVFFQRSCLITVPYLVSTSSGVLMTAFAFSKPVVATNVTGLTEYVEQDVTGLLVPPADTEQLAEAIVVLLKDKIRRRQMGEQARLWVQAWQEDVTKKTLNAYEQAIAIRSRNVRPSSAQM